MTCNIPILIPIDKDAPYRASFLLDLPVVIGRGWDAAIRVESPNADMRHCVIYRDGENLAVKDLHTWAGTYVNGQRILQRDLRVGDRLRIADLTFLISCLGSSSTPSPPAATSLDSSAENEWPVLGVTCAAGSIT